MLEILALNVTHICLTDLKFDILFRSNAFWKAYRACQQTQGRKLGCELKNAIL